MHVYIGGAYNGKKKYVKEKYAAYNLHIYEGTLPKNQLFNMEDAVIISNFENIVAQSLHKTEEECVREIMAFLEKLDRQTSLICICTDIGRGIVPLEKEQRKIRDTCGRLYQALFTYSEQVTRIWYGLPEVLKGEKNE